MSRNQPLPLSHKLTQQLKARIVETVRAFAQERGLDQARVDQDAAFIFAHLAYPVIGIDYREWLNAKEDDRQVVGGSPVGGAAEAAPADRPRGKRGRRTKGRGRRGVL